MISASEQAASINSDLLNRLNTLIARIMPLDHEAMAAARARQAMLTKPPGSLGRLEDLSIQMAGITGQVLPKVHHKVVIVMAGDHGIAQEGVSAYPQEVTSQMVLNFLAGGAAINVLARQAGARVVVTDMGVASDLPNHPTLRAMKIAPGTDNITRGPAMSVDQALRSLLAGAEVIAEQCQLGLDVLATGDMGIGNTTASASIAAAIMGKSPQVIAGRGTGIDDEGLKRKVAVIQHALDINQPNPENGLEVLAKVGGFEIGGIAGAILAAAAERKAVVVDGFISTAAAMIAVQLAPKVRGYLIAAHCSQERGHRLMMEWLGLEPLLDMRMRLGEGSGAVLAMNLVDAACRVLSEMATFAEAGVSSKQE